MEQSQSGQQPPLDPLATVILVSFQHGAALRRALQSLDGQQERSRLHVLVLDLGAHDTTPAWDLEYPNVTFLRMPRHFGSTKAMNIGIRSAKADLLLFLDPAVELAPDCVALLVAAIEQIPDAGAVTPLLTDPAGTPQPQIRPLPNRSMLAALCRDETALPAAAAPPTADPVPNEYASRQALLVRRSFLKGMNYFDEGYGDWGGDLELAFQIRHAGKRAYLIPDAKGIDHSATSPRPPWRHSQQAIFAADRCRGAAHYLAKRAGFIPGLLLQFQAILFTLGRLLILDRPGFHWPLLLALLSGTKIDGSQSSV